MSPDAAQIGDTRASGGAVTDTHVSVAAAAGARVACAEARVATAEAESAKWRGYAKAWVRLCSEQARDALKTRMICEMSGEALSEAIPGLPNHVIVEHLLRSDNADFADPATVARLNTVSPAFREAVTASGLRQKELRDWEARKLLCLSALRRMKRRGKLGRDKYVCEVAAGLGALDELKALRQNDTPWNWRTCEAAARYGRLEVLQWARQNECPWSKDTCVSAAMGGHLKVLKWAHENGCKWNTETCVEAAARGDLEMLQWAHEKGCKWKADTCLAAAKSGHFEML